MYNQRFFCYVCVITLFFLIIKPAHSQDGFDGEYLYGTEASIAPGSGAGIYGTAGPTTSDIIGQGSLNHGTPPPGWLITGPSLSIVVPTSAATAQYEADVTIRMNGDPQNGSGDWGNIGQFNVVPNKPGPRSGSPYGTELSVGGVNTANGNKLTEVPIVSWDCKGGLTVTFNLFNSSQSTRGLAGGIPSTLTPKWIESYESYIDTTPLAQNNFTGPVKQIFWGDETNYIFNGLANATGAVPIGGVHDKEVDNGDGSIDITRTNNLKYHFVIVTQLASSRYRFLQNITDLNGFRITIGRDSASGKITTITDPSNRQIRLTYDLNGRLSTIEDPLNRTWVLHYDAGPNLDQLVDCTPILGH